MVFAFIGFLVLMFFVFVVVFRKIMNQNVSSAVQHLDEINQEYLKKQEEIEKKLAEAENTYQETVNKAKDEALKIRQDLLKQAKEQSEAAIKSAKDEATDIIQQAEKTRHALISEMEKRIAADSVKKAAVLLGKVLPAEVRERVHAQLVKELIEVGLKELDNHTLAKDLKEVKVISALRLTTRDQDLIFNRLQSTIPKGAKIVEDTDPDLVAGSMVVLGSLVIDGSLRFKIAESAKDIVEKINE